MTHFDIKNLLMIVLLSLAVMMNQSCRDDIEIIGSEEIELEKPGDNSESGDEPEPEPEPQPNPEDDELKIIGYKGFYLLNEGNMGSNKSTLDFFNFETGKYIRNIYAERNPEVPKEMGDVGNDIAIYGSKLYAVINASNKVEVMNAETTKRIGQVDIPNCRYIKFHEGYAYITSYAGPIEINPDYQQKGFVAKVDTATLEIVDKCIVGFQPDELEILDGKIYVANSGGYMGAGNSAGYERTVSVIDIESFSEDNRIDVAINLHRIRADKQGNLWVTSRGDYFNEPSQIYIIDKDTKEVTDTIAIAANSMWMDDDMLYVVSSAFSYITFEYEVSYSVIDTNTRKVVKQNFITDGTDNEIEMPYGIMVNPKSKDIYLTDAGNYVTSGVLYCFDKNGKKKWDVRTGDIPAHFALLPIYGKN